MLTQPEVRGPDPAVYRAPPPPAYVLGRASEAAPTIHLMGTVTSYPRNTEIFGESEPADYLYNVINGGVRTYKIFSDGRRQIGGFYLPGDVVGLAASAGPVRVKDRPWPAAILRLPASSLP